MLPRLPRDALASVGALLDPADVACCRAACRALAAALPAPASLPARLACEGTPERLAWFLDAGGLPACPALLLAASSGEASTAGALMLASAACCRDSPPGPETLRALHAAACAVARRWADPGLLADMARDWLDVGGPSLAEVAAGGGGGRALCAAAARSSAPTAARARLLRWICLQGAADPGTAVQEAWRASGEAAALCAASLMLSRPA